MLSKQFIKDQEQRLLKEKTGLEKELKSFAKSDSRIKGNWKTKFPDFGVRTADLSEETDQIEEYEATLPIEYRLEEKLQKINVALIKIRKKTYGTCQKCKKGITIKRLKANPEAELCIKCTKGGSEK